jgi:hypothetical protein
MDEMEENTPASEIVECPHCYTRVLPLANNICPACQNNIFDMQDVDPNQVSLSLHESEELPAFCYSCNQYTERHVRVSGDKESDLEKVILGLGILFTRPSKRTEVGTTNVIIYLPQCEQCGEYNNPEPIDVDYERQTMTFIVQRGFHDRVFQLRDI